MMRLPFCYLATSRLTARGWRIELMAAVILYWGLNAQARGCSYQISAVSALRAKSMRSRPHLVALIRPRER